MLLHARSSLYLAHIRRQFLILSATFYGLGAMSGQVEAEVAVARNVLMIAVDDLKPMLHCYGHEQMHTQNIDALASRGTLFLNAHCQQAVCAASRASLMTGLRPDTTRVYDFETPLRDTLPDVVTLPQHFKNNGYCTVGIGKTFDAATVDNAQTMDERSWSRPYLWPPSPAAATFGYRSPKQITRIERRLAKAEAKNITGRKQLTKFLGCRFPTEAANVDDEAYDDGAYAAEACRQIQVLAKQDAPFFLAVGFLKPHLPFCAPQRYWDLYDREEIDLANWQRMPSSTPAFHFQDSWELRGGYDGVPEGRLPDDYQRELIHGYYACISYVDEQVGKLITALEKAGVADSTTIVLWGDHGWHLGDHGMWCKHTNYEQATRVPLIIYSPCQKTSGGCVRTPIELIDILPTLCELVDIEHPDGLEGVSRKPQLDSPNLVSDTVAFSQYPRRSGHDNLMGYAVRSERYRLIRWFPTNKVFQLKDLTPVASELYDYKSDPLETRNVYSMPEYSKTGRLLAIELEEYFQSRPEITELVEK